MSHTLVVLLVLVLSVLFCSGHGFDEPSHNCVHDALKEKIEVIQAPQKYSTEKVKRVMKGGTNKQTPLYRVPFQNIRITVDKSVFMNDPATCYSAGKFVKIGKPSGPSPNPKCSSTRFEDCWKQCEDADVLTKEKSDFVMGQLIPHAVDYLQRVIKTNRVLENLVIPPLKKGGCGDNLAIPVNYSAEGIPNTDLVLIVTGRPTMQHTIAWAVECASDQSGRPIFGHINVGPGNLKNFEQTIDYYFRVVVHEMTHVLGFNNGKFDLYRDVNGNKYPRVTMQSTSPQGTAVEKIVTPKALAAAREHFGCQQLDGVLLEDGGGHSTSKSHWEKRVFRNEYMTGTSDQHSVFSKVTLAFLEDMGWYEVDYSQAEYLDWGKNMGCQFVQESCTNWNSYGYFCRDVDTKSCTSNRNSIGYCNLAKQSKVPSAFRYFSNPNLAGSDELADYCPYIQAYSNGLCTDVKNRPHHAEVVGSDYGPNSRCFESSIAKIGATIKDEIQPLCYNYRCDVGLEVQIDGDWYACPFDGIIENVAGFNGILKCPPRSFCSSYGANRVSHSPSKSKYGNKNSHAAEQEDDGDFNFDSLFSGDDNGGSGFNFFGSASSVSFSVVLFVVAACIAAFTL